MPTSWVVNGNYYFIMVASGIVQTERSSRRFHFLWLKLPTIGILEDEHCIYCKAVGWLICSGT